MRSESPGFMKDMEGNQKLHLEGGKDELDCTAT